MKRVWLVSISWIAACASGAPAPVTYGDAERAPVPRAEPARQATPQTQTERTGALSDYALRPEDVQPLDPTRLPRTHRVGANEAIYDIATRYQIPMLALIDQNGLGPPYALSPGHVLELPPPRFHVVERGESLRDVAERHAIDPRSLALLNRLAEPYEVRPGDRLVLPAMAAARASEPDAPAPPLTAPRASGEARFAWPLRGDVVGRFGAQSNGARIDGIEIAGREGSRVLAAADGDVVYAGADLESYGALVLVRHAGNYVSAYGYGARVLVREGQRVRAGEAIAEVGARGRLLFQVRQGRDVVDPMPLLGEGG